MPEAFNVGWNVAKMPPYYHGTPSKYLDSIREHGLIPKTIEESHWYKTSDVPHDDTPNVFVSDSAKTALQYALLYGTSDKPEYIDDEAFSHPNRPIVLEIDDEVDELPGFERNKGWGDYKIPTAISPELLSILFEGPRYRKWDDDGDPDEEHRKDWNQYHTVLEQSDWRDWEDRERLG